MKEPWEVPLFPPAFFARRRLHPFLFPLAAGMALFSGCSGGGASAPGNNPPGTATRYVFSRAFGSLGTGSGQFQSPFGVAADSAGDVFVSDSGLGQIDKYKTDGTLLTTFRSPPSPIPYQSLSPGYLTTDSAGNVFASVRSFRGELTSHIDEFAPDGSFRTPFASYAALNGTPTGIAAAGGLIYVAAEGTIIAFHSDGTKAFSFLPFADDTLNPHSADGLAVDGAGNVFLADSAGHSLRKFDSQGKLLRVFGAKGSGNGNLQSPTGIAVDSQGNVYTADGVSQEVEKFSNTGTFITSFGSFGAGDGQFTGPEGIALDAAGNVYVADSGNGRVEVFQPQ